MKCQRACRIIWRDQAENNEEITAEIQGNYPNFKQNLAEEENFLSSQVSRGLSVIANNRTRAARFQNWTNRVLSNEIRILKQ